MWGATAACDQDKLTVAIAVSENREPRFYRLLPPLGSLSPPDTPAAPLPIMLSTAETSRLSREAGIAVVSIPAVASDTRTNEVRLGHPHGKFYRLYPSAATARARSRKSASPWRTPGRPPVSSTPSK